MERGRQLIRPVRKINGLVHHPRWLNEASGGEKAKSAEQPMVKSFYRRQRRFFEALAEEPTMTLTELYSRSGIGAEQAVQLRKHLEKQGLINIHSINPGGRGKRFSCIEPTEKGLELIKKLGIDYRMAGKGGFIHRYWVWKVMRYMEAEGWVTRVEGEHPGVDDLADVSLEKDGKRVAVEVELSGKHVAENLSRDFDNGYDVVVVVVTTSKMEESVREIISGSFSLWGERVLVVRACEFLNPQKEEDDRG